MSTCAVLRHYNAAKQLKTILTLCTRTTGYTHTHGGCCENVTVNKCKKCRFIKTCKAIIDTYKTAKIPSVTSRGVDIIHSFWTTVCKTVRRTLSVRCPVCPVLSVKFVHCGQTAVRIKMKLGIRTSLGPGHIVLGGDPAPPPLNGHSLPPNFWPISVAAKWLHGSRCHLAWR